MIIVGAKGLAKEVLEIVSVDLKLLDDDIVFFDNVSIDLPKLLFQRFKILNSFDEVQSYLNDTKDKSFLLGLGNPKYRAQLFYKFISIGAEPITVISKQSNVGSFGVHLGVGTTIMPGAAISNDVKIGKGVLIYYNTVVAHDCILGDFVQVSPNANILGRCKVGNNSFLGAGCTILPDVEVGENVVIGAGAVVTKDVPDNVTLVGVPAKIIKS